MQAQKGCRVLRGARGAMAFAVLLLVSACASVSAPKEPFASKSEIAQAKDQLLTCAHDAIARYDDGVSPAGTIAMVVAGKCDDQFRALYRRHIQGWEDDLAYLKGFREGFTPERVFVGLVLSDRGIRARRRHGGGEGGFPRVNRDKAPSDGRSRSE